jgi:DNA-binding MarR family transcriptional regulator
MKQPMRQKPESRERERVQCACTNLKRASRVVGRAYDEALAPAGLNATQYAILANVGRHQPISQMSLADLLDLERTSLYRAVALLESNGWLESSPLGEGVTKVLALTKKGTDVLAKARPRWERVQGEFVAAFGKTKWEGFLATLDTIREHFSEP